ncbi:hypothetical protein SELMODRAFT_231581 [Selaginella moellendorffii]|uniref:Uncharacterized protein n=1 Tax=Selaginella moellendorffii TaxID=88036 RepID=D8RGQ6_SELML|nr:hypothetical protein SELMODRAFT_231581 [Selaginella moellendorffii]
MAANSNSTCKLASTTSHGIWQGDNPIEFSLSLLIVQIILVLTVTRVLGLLLKPLRQPRVIAEIIGGVLLGPSALGRNSDYLAKIFTKQSLSILTTFANMGLMFFLFMVGLELDLASLKRTGKQAAAISIAGISLPFAAGVGVSFVLHNTVNPDTKLIPFLVFMGVALSITAFPVLARILAERRLLTTDVGKMAIAAAAANDVVAWIFLALAVALSGTGRSPAVAAWILLCGVAFVLAMFLFVKPLMAWIASRSPADQPVKELYVCIALGGVLVSGFVTDFIGIHGIFGAFVFGLIIPEGHFAHALIEKIEDFVNILMLPLYFAASGLQTDIGSISGARSFGLLVLVIVTACGGKILGTLAVSMAYGENFRKALTLGFLMNTKGLVELIVLNIGKERKVLNEEMFAIMVIMALFTTFITTPVVMALYKPARDQVPYKRRKLSRLSPIDEQGNKQLRVLACVHGMKNVPTVMNLIESIRGSNRKELFRLYILQLVELTERSSAIMMVQRVRQDGLPVSRAGGSSFAVVNGIAVAFGAFAQLNKVTLRSLTAITALPDMHDDICTTAANKRAAVIILPFHKYARADGLLETMHPGFQTVNQRVLVHAPCSVGILIDRGASAHQISSMNVNHSVAVFFFGGPDDREALAVGMRMAEHPGIKLSVVKFMVDHQQHQQQEQQQQQHVVSIDAAGSGLHDQHHLGHSGRRSSDFASMIPRLTSNEHGLLIVGRGRRPIAGMASLSRRQATYAELGPVGDALAVANEDASVLVVQQYDPVLVPGNHADVGAAPTAKVSEGTSP